MCVQNKKSNPQSFNLKYKLETSCSWLFAVDRPEKKESLCKEVSREELGKGVAAQSGDGEDAEGDPVPDAHHLPLIPVLANLPQGELRAVRQCHRALVSLNLVSSTVLKRVGCC